ncbi:MAG: D-alanine--D-alanine ligase family protein [Acidobacteriota bacterium]
MSDRPRIVVVFGGRSVEHAVSIRSARSVLAAIDLDRYEVVPVAVDRDGTWFTSASPLGVREGSDTSGERRSVRILPEPGRGFLLGSGAGWVAHEVHCVFPLIHGAGGEDGTLQGLLELADLAYVGPGPLASALAMDKAVAKRLLRQAGLPVLPDSVVTDAEWRADAGAVLRRLRSEQAEGPWFVKPSCGGSSVGATRAAAPDDLSAAIDTALEYDLKALVERALDAREIEISVCGNDRPEVSVAGEIVPAREFYDYQSKYADERTRLLVPAPLDGALADRLGALALATFTTLGAAGMSRVDFLVEKSTGRPWISEMNTIPGFTDISMYPRLWEASGLPYRQLIDRLIELGRERFERRTRLQRGLTSGGADRPVV